MIENLKKYLAMNWESLSLESPPLKASDLLAVKIGDFTDDFIRVYLFGKGSSELYCMAKLVRDPKRADTLQREFDVLTHLRQLFQASDTLPNSFPRPLMLAHLEKETVLLLGVTPGISLERLLAGASFLPFRARKVLACLENLRESLEAFQQCTLGRQISEDVRAWKILVSRIRAECSIKSSRVIARLNSACDELGTIRYHSVACHGNLSPRSIIATGQRQNQLVDWQGFRISGHPLDDPLDLAFSTIAATTRLRSKQSAPTFSDPQSSLQNALLLFIARFQRSTGLSPTQTYLYMLFHAFRRWDGASRSPTNYELGFASSLLQAFVEEESQIVARLDALGRLH